MDGSISKRFEAGRIAGWLVALMLVFNFTARMAGSQAPTSGRLRGTVTMSGAGVDSGTPLHGVTVRIVEQKEVTITEEGGSYVFTDVPPGEYTVVARMDGFRDAASTITIAAGSNVTADFSLRLLGPREEITVTASGHEEVASQSFKVVTTLDSVELAENAQSNIGEVLEHQPGIA